MLALLAGQYGPSRLTQERVDQYDKEMHTLLPQISGLHAVIAGMDQQVHADLAPLVERAIELDAAIGDAGLSFVVGEAETAIELAKHHESSMVLEKQLHHVVAEAISRYAVSDSADSD